MTIDSFRAYRIFSEDGKSAARLVRMALDELDPGEVVIRTACSGVNYKDALAVTGAGRVIRRFPCNGGIDMAGVVMSSADPRFRAGDEVICTSYDMGVSHDGGFSEVVRVPADWVVPLPAGLSLYESMCIGTAGYTAALGVVLMEQNGLTPAAGKVVVTGATGGVSSLAIDMLARKGYHVVAVTGKDGSQDYLRQLGAKEVLARGSIEWASPRPMEKALWAGAVDSVGGEQLSWLIRTMQQDGVIASIGNAGGIEFRSTVLPFILRGVRLLGCDSGYTHMPLRRKVWERLASDLKPVHLRDIVHDIGFDELPPVFEMLVRAQVRGRYVVRFA
ncbi:MAG TPA: oxidoreductase [Burkholderiales bacterium]|nr:oxidoreductase [Burkholderiales bacterium]